MLFYLTGAARVNLLDFLEAASGLIPKKMTGQFSLMRFVVRDMRNYAHARYFVIDRAAAQEDDPEFVEAVSSFRAMFDARVIVICEGYAGESAFVRGLVAAGVTDIVTAQEIRQMQAEILECLSPAGMQRFIQPEPQASALPERADHQAAAEQYLFQACNVHIAVAGSQRRVGVTTTAVNLAYWIQAHGGTACVVESNAHDHLSYVLRLYAGEPSGGRYEIAGLDYYLDSRPERDYQFIIHDCGELLTPPSEFAGAGLRLLCASAMPYELPQLFAALERCAGLPVKVLGMCVPPDMQALLAHKIEPGVLFARPSYSLFDEETNQALYKELLHSYIAGIAMKAMIKAAG